MSYLKVSFAEADENKGEWSLCYVLSFSIIVKDMDFDITLLARLLEGELKVDTVTLPLSSPVRRLKHNVYIIKVAKTIATMPEYDERSK